jgi:hypothetical protein
MGTETGKHGDVNTRERVSRTEVRNDKAITFQLVDLGCLVVNRKLGLSEGSQAGSVGLEKLLEDFASFFNDDLSRRAG